MMEIIVTCCIIMTVCVMFGASVLGYLLYDDWKSRREAENLTYVREQLQRALKKPISDPSKYDPLAADDDFFIPKRNQ